ncbi:MAG: diacylglycerol/polyprenol kinase family protein [Christensenellales bacterium]|jgi:phytol kinase
MIPEFLIGFGILLCYFAVCASCAILIRRKFAVPQELFRKLLHMILLCSLLVWVYAFRTWQMSAAAAALFTALVYPLLTFAQRYKGYSELLVERGRGEIRRSLVIVFFMFSLLIVICWGWLGERWLALACAYAWGFGDAAAALVGKRFGKHGLKGRFIEGRKSVEGTAAMFLVSFAAVLIALLVNHPGAWYAHVPVAALTGAVCAAVELYTRGGMDTLTCPLAAAAVLIPILLMWGV